MFVLGFSFRNILNFLFLVIFHVFIVKSVYSSSDGLLIERDLNPRALLIYEEDDEEDQQLQQYISEDDSYDVSLIRQPALIDEEPPIRILCIDGGGIRGLIPAIMLEKLERRTGKSTFELFDMIAGTSIGGIMALMLTTPDHSGKYAKHSAKDLVELLETGGNEIFSSTTWRSIKKMKGLNGAKYSHRSLEAKLKEKMGNKSLLSKSLIDTVVTAYETERDMPYIFKSWEAAEKKEADFNRWKVGRATSAAPTFFQPLQTRNELGELYSFIDGGVVVNNPAMAAYVEARKKYGPDRRIILVSIGTGKTIDSIPYASAKKWGPIKWVVPLIHTTMSGVSNLVDEQMKTIVKSTGDTYARLQAVLKAGEGSMDNCSQQNLQNLRYRAEASIEANRHMIEAIVPQLVRN